MLDRWDRRVATTIVLFMSVLIPALVCTDVGLVLAWTGTVAATNLSYIGPGILFIGVHGQEFLDIVENRWGYTSLSDINLDKQPGLIEMLLWYIMMMPLWCGFAATGKKGLSSHLAKKAEMTPAYGYRLGKIRHKHGIMQPSHKKMFQKYTDYDDSESEDEKSPRKGGVKSGVATSVELGLITASAPIVSYGSTPSKKLGNGYELVETAEEGGEVEDDPQDEKQSGSDFVVAIAFIFFGIIALVAGIYSICTTGS